MTPKHTFMYAGQKVIEESEVSSRSKGTCGGISFWQGDTKSYLH